MTVSNAFGTEKRSNLAFGIDLGTTNSAISVALAGELSQIIKLDNGKITMPSCVMWKGGDKFIIGQEAYSNRYKASVAYSSKRLMGTEETVTLKYGRQELEVTPTFVASKVLEGLVDKVSFMYPNVKDVVITVPAYFNHNQVSETIKAGKMAGLNVLKILREPTAAAHSYKFEGVGSREETILVYDLGGGTFDVAILKISIIEGGVSDEFADLYDMNDGMSDSKHIYRVLAVGGDNQLGGDDIDQELLKQMLTYLSNQGIDVNSIPKEDISRLTLELEKIKKVGTGYYTVPFQFKANKVAHKIELDITPANFEQAVYTVYRKTRTIMKNTIAQSGLIEGVDRVVLVGGSTKSDILKGFLKRDLPNTPISDSLNPDEAVALGAGIMARKEKFGDDTISSSDVLPIGIGVVSDDKLKVMIRPGQVLPYTTSSVFKTTVDNQTEMEIHIRQGNNSILADSVSLGMLVIKDVPPKKAGEVSVTVGLKINSEGVLTCTAKSEGKTHTAEIVNIFSDKDKTKKTTSREDSILARWKVLLDKNKGTSLGESISQVMDLYSKGDLSLVNASKEISTLLIKSRDIKPVNTHDVKGSMQDEEYNA